MVETLSRWKRRFSNACTLECSEMRLIGRDGEGVIFSGPGRIEIDGSSSIRLSMHGSTTDSRMAFRKIVAARKEPYDVLEQFRLLATDYEGNEWAGGYTAIDLFFDFKHGWPLAGKLQGLSTKVSGSWVAATSSVELLFLPSVDLPMNEWMTTSTMLGEEELGWSRKPGRQVIDVLGTKVVFKNDMSGDALWLTAETNAQRLYHPFAEHWLSEPLRILLGALLYPRLIARNFGDGSAFVTLLPVPKPVKPSQFGLLQPFGAERADFERFWQLYADILSMVAGQQNPDLQVHELTRLYEELCQVQRGSRWSIILTLASAIEALAKSLMSEDDRRSEFSEEALNDMERYLRAWGRDDNLRGRMLSNLSLIKQRSVLAFLRRRAETGSFNAEYVETWRKLRNSVMHGELVEPWSTKEGDRHMQELVALFHRLTEVRIANAKGSVGS